MTPQIETLDRAAGPEYAALRQGGTPAWKARTLLRLSAPAAARLERYLRRRGEGYPRFASDAAHVEAVRAAGGFPVLGPVLGPALAPAPAEAGR